jgi:penicillin-binding protein 1A
VRQITWLFRGACIVLAGALLLSATVIAVGPRLWRVANAHEELPVVLPAFQPLSQRSLVYDRFGNVIWVYERENSQPIALTDVPTDVVRAILAVEDAQYYEHKGVNVRSLARALLSNFSSDAPRQGASTITQQVVKNEYLAGLPRDGRYKLLQAHYALMLEKEMGKDDILARYLNTVYFGNNAYGLEAAAEVYFGKSAKELTMVEGAFLAGLVRSPTGFDPIRRPEASKRRFTQVVERLVATEMVTEVEGEQIEATFAIPEVTKTPPNFTVTPTYYTAALTEYLLQRSTLLGATEQDRASLLYRGGLRLYTTFDPNLQALAEQARNVLPDTLQGFDAAMVTLDTATAAVRAMVGGKQYIPRDRELNMALQPRQTGSSIKIFILAAAMQAGAQPNDLIDGTRPCELPNPGNEDEPFLIEEGAAGSLNTLQNQTWLSINCAFGRLSQIVGLNRVVDTTYRMAASPYLYRDQPNRRPIEPFASFATGANEMAPIDMASGFQTIANQGLHHDPYYVDRIERPDGTVLYEHADAGTQVLDLGPALTATQTMKGVLRSGTAQRSLREFPFPASGKTGTQENNTNSWFVGATTKLTTAVWVGDPNGYTEMVDVPEFLADTPSVRKVQGGTYPARIWGAMMEPASAADPPADWAPAPPNARAAVRLYLPGNECLFRNVGGPIPNTTPGSTATTTATTVAPGPDGVVPTVPPPVLRPLPPGTTIAPDNLDPKAPLPFTSLQTVVQPCSGVVVPPTTAPD